MLTNVSTQDMVLANRSSIASAAACWPSRSRTTTCAPARARPSTSSAGGADHGQLRRQPSRALGGRCRAHVAARASMDDGRPDLRLRGGPAVGGVLRRVGRQRSARRGRCGGQERRPTDQRRSDGAGFAGEGLEVWIGKAGKELESYKAERDEQRRVNRDLNDKQQELLRVSRRWRAAQVAPLDAARAASAPGMAAGPANPPLANPPESTLPRAPAALPPAPPPPVAYQRGAMPPGLPNSASPVASTSRRAGAASAHAGHAGRASARQRRRRGRRQGRETLDSFLPISFTKGQLLGGLDAPTGGQAQSNPHPVLIRLSDNSVLPNRYRAEYRECFVIAAGYGDISSGARLPAHRTPVLRSSQRRSAGSEDPGLGLRRRRQGRHARPPGHQTGPDAGQRAARRRGQRDRPGFLASQHDLQHLAAGVGRDGPGGDAYRAGIGSGVGKALDRLAQYYIKLAEQTFPIIEVDAGREIDVVLTKGVRIEGSDASTASNAPPRCLAARTPPSAT